MGYNSRILALVIASAVALLTTGFLFLVDSKDIISMIVVSGISFSSSFLFLYITFEYLIFNEINNMYAVLNKLRKNEPIAHHKNRQKASSNPFRKLNEEIYDLTHQKQLEINELKRMEEYRREFLANVSHELKTPIFSAQGFIHTLLDGAMEDKEVNQKFLKKSSKSLDSLSILVQDLITISQLESGEITMQKEFFNIRRMVVDIFDQLEAKADKKKMALSLTPKDTKPIEAYGDAQRIRQVVTNLIDNAIKYGNENGSVQVILEEISNGVRVTIGDNGPGIDPEKLPRIFERFFRVDKHRSRESGGTGLGLSIVKHIIESHNSSIRVDSNPGEGTVFTFVLPSEYDENEDE